MKRFSFLLRGSLTVLLFMSGNIWAMGHAPVTAPALIPVAPTMVENATAVDFKAIEDDHGGFYILWTQQPSTTSYTIVAQHVDDQGKPMWVSPGIGVGGDIPDVSNWDAFSDGQGGVTVTWLRDDVIKAQRLGTGGNLLWDAGLILDSSSFTVASPVGAADAAGGAFIVWPEQRYNDRWVLVSQHVNNQGVPIWNPDGERVSRYPSDQENPRIISDGESGAIVGWRDVRSKSSRLQAQRVDYQGNYLWGQQGILVNSPAESSTDNPHIESLGAGRAIAEWLGSESGVSRQFFLAISGEGDSLWDTNGLTLAKNPGEQWNPVMLGAWDGVIWTGWADHRDQTHWQLYVGALDLLGQPILPGGGIALAPAPADEGGLALAPDGQGGVFGAWLDNRQGTLGLYAQNLDRKGIRHWGDSGKTVALGLVKPLPPKILALSEGHAAIIWVDQLTPGQWTFYWDFVSNKP